MGLKETFPPFMPSMLIMMLYRKEGQKAAVLIDGYDAAINRNITKPAMAEKVHRTIMRFYGVLKTKDTETGHIFMTGVNRFLRTSDVSQLVDITIGWKYDTICGLTEKDLDDLLCDRQEDPPCER
jgi:hypothetical protein